MENNKKKFIKDKIGYDNLRQFELILWQNVQK